MASHLNIQPFHILIATASPADLQLIAKSFRNQMPVIQLSITDTLDLTQQHLQTSQLEIYNFPRLLILDLELADRLAIWAFIQQTKATYPQLPIIVTSLDDEAETIAQVHRLHVNFYMIKAPEWTDWKKQVEALAYYWLEVASLPK